MFSEKMIRLLDYITMFHVKMLKMENLLMSGKWEQLTILREYAC